MLSTKVIVTGRRLNVAVLIEGGGSECLEFIENLAQSTKRKIKATMKRLAEHGEIRNDEIFKSLRDKIWEFKANNARVYCFYDRNAVVCTHGAYKTKRKRTSVEIRRAKSLRAQYLVR